MAAPHFLRTFNVPLFVPLTYFIRSRFANFSTRRNKPLHTQGHLSFAGKNSPLYCCVFSSISLSVCLKLTVWNVVDVLARSSISRSHCGRLSPILQLSHRSILLAFILFCCFLMPWLLPSRRYCFSCLGCRAILRFSTIFNSSRHFFTMPFSSLPSILSLFSQQYRGFSFKAGP